MNDRRDGHQPDDATVMPDEGSPVEAPDRFPPLDPNQDTTSEQACRRRQALSMYLEQLEETQRSGQDLREAFAGIELDGWELLQLANGLDDSAQFWQSLIAEGVALRNKYVTDLGWLPADDASVEEKADLRELLIADAALGLALLAETQQAVNRLILAGAIDEAKKLTSFRNKIGQSVHALKDQVGEGGFNVAEEMSEALITPAAEATWTVMEARERAPAAPRQRTHTAGRTHASSKTHAAGGTPGGQASKVVFKRRQRRNQIKPLLVVLGLAVVAWAVFILPRINQKPLPVLTLQDVTPRAEIRHVEALPPSLYVELDDYKWNALSKDDRLALVDDVGRTAEAAGYHGVNFSLEDGRTAAQWLKKRGSELVK